MVCVFEFGCEIEKEKEGAQASNDAGCRTPPLSPAHVTTMMILAVIFLE